jgi:hypothetical protein
MGSPVRATRPPTPNERRFLTGLLQPNPALPSRPGWWTVPELLHCQPDRFGDRTPQGLHETGASCVRKGLARKNHGRPVMYQLADAGRAALGNPAQGGSSR